MRNIFVACALLSSFYLTSYAQSSDVQKEKMKIFQNWVGRWRGEGTSFMGPAGPKSSNVEEKIEMKLGGLLLVVEGVGKTTDTSTGKEKLVHQAFGVMSYDPYSNQYKFRSYVMEGHTADAWFNVLGENNYQWGFEFPSGRMRFTISIDPAKNNWNEVGEYSSDGTTWRKTFEMNLHKVE